MALAEAPMTDEPTAEPVVTQALVRPPSWGEIKEQSAMLEAAGKGTSILPKGITNRYQIAAILQKGAELGFTPMYALEQIALVDGKPVVQGQALAKLIIRAEGKHAIKWAESTEERCTVGLKRREDSTYQTLTWTIEDAKRANLTGKSNWKNYPRTMLRWRALAEAARMYMPDVISGVYTPDEMGLSVDVRPDGTEVIDLAPVLPPASTKTTETRGEPTNRPTKAQKDTLQAVCAEVAQIRGKGEGWSMILRAGCDTLGLAVKSTSDLTAAQVTAITKWAAGQRDSLRANQEPTAAEGEVVEDVAPAYSELTF